MFLQTYLTHDLKQYVLEYWMHAENVIWNSFADLSRDLCFLYGGSTLNVV